VECFELEHCFVFVVAYQKVVKSFCLRSIQIHAMKCNSLTLP
jgi:hypothetical protein